MHTRGFKPQSRNQIFFRTEVLIRSDTRFWFRFGQSPKDLTWASSRPRSHPIQRSKECWACGVDKAPGFNGYNFKFIREMWEVINEEIYEFVQSFFQCRVSLRSIYITWVTLVPKVEDPTSIDQYRPISMVGALYKIISKLLFIRLKEVLAHIID